MSGFNPRRIAIVVGMVLTNLVTSRLIHGLTFLPSIPSMIACPANVLVVDEDNPDDRRVIPKITAAGGPKRGMSVFYVMSMVVTVILRLNVSIAIIIMSLLTSPAIVNIMTLFAC